MKRLRKYWKFKMKRKFVWFMDLYIILNLENGQFYFSVLREARLISVNWMGYESWLWIRNKYGNCNSIINKELHNNTKIKIFTSVTGKETKKREKNECCTLCLYFRRRKPVSSIGNHPPSPLLWIFCLTFY